MATPWEELPDEIKTQVASAWAAQQQQADMHNMALESSRHRIINFLESLDEEGLQVLLGIFRNIVADTDNETIGYYSGLVASLLAKQGVCLMCHVKHLDPLAEADEARDEPYVSPAHADEDADRLMEEYGLTLNDDDIVCKGCGTVYQSLKDRMLRPPGPAGCEGCKQTTKWGGTEPTYDPTIGEG